MPALALLLAAAVASTPDGLPAVGSSELRVVTPSLLEVRLVTRAAPLDAAPDRATIAVSTGGRRIAVERTGLRRRVLYAPLRRDDLRLGTSVLLALAEPLAEGATVEVALPGVVGVQASRWTTRLDASRLGPALHASLVGYLPDRPKRAYVGFYAGTLGEGPIDARSFEVRRAADGVRVFRGPLARRPDSGMPGTPPAYQAVLEADFSALREPGDYVLSAPGLGRTAPFRIGDEVAARLARAYAIGLLHQRCGAAVSLPFTRFVHDACHVAPALVPSAGGPALDRQLEAQSRVPAADPPRAAPRLDRLAAALFPAVATGPRDVRGGHHDAGDYGKYTIDSALFVHHLVFAADALPGVSALDNLGLPESGDGRGDVLELAAREADFLAKMQDDDGGFFFLVRPRDRAYEDDALPAPGDPQVVFPKNTSATAAATAALAQAGSSAAMRAALPEAAARYAAAARRGWAFLQRAWAARGRDAAYQKVTHYGDVFEDRDEVAWAATEIWLAEGDTAAHARLLAEFDPSRKESRRWGWWRLFEGYGAAARSYAFAPLTGRARGRALDRVHLARCATEVIAGALDQSAAASASAYGTSYPGAGKRGLRAGWYFGENAVFDLVVAERLAEAAPSSGLASAADRAAFSDAVAGNLAHLTGANPLDLAFVTGLAERAPREVVHSYAVNDRRALPPDGLPVGNLQQGLPWIRPYEGRLRGTSLPPDDGPSAYPIYDRYSDTFNVSTEATVVDQARALAAAAALLARTPLARQPWRAAAARITGLPAAARAGEAVTLRLEADGLDSSRASVVWESEGRVFRGAAYTLSSATAGDAWVEAEALWPDGRRAFAAGTLRVR